jgi:pimeloyl-ACP methyl ester carboxylesterase
MNLSKFLAAVAVGGMMMTATGSAFAGDARPSIVLVHGGFVDGSGWESVYDILTHDGYQVSIVQNPTSSLAEDVAFTKRVLAAQPGPVVLVGHSYGGAVITEAGNADNVKALVYITAFALDAGESVQTLISKPVPGATPPPILPPQDGWLMLDSTKFAAAFAGDVQPKKAQFMANSQVPWNVAAAGGTISTPAWKSKPAFYLVVHGDHMIPEEAQRFMAKRANATVANTNGSHAIYVSNPKVVATLIEQAAKSVAASSK